jgi:hypothetical protein
MRPYVIQIKNGSTVRLEFGAMAPDSLTAAEQHECLCDHKAGEYVHVVPSRQVMRASHLNEAEREEAARERKALEMQCAQAVREERWTR